MSEQEEVLVRCEDCPYDAYPCLWRVAPVPVTVPYHVEGAPGPSPLGTGDIDTMQARISIRMLDTSMTPSCTSPKLHPGAAMTDLRVWKQCWYGFLIGGRGGWRSRISLKTLKSRRQRAVGHPPADSLQVKGQFQNQRSCSQIVTMMQAAEPGHRYNTGTYARILLGDSASRRFLRQRRVPHP